MCLQPFLLQVIGPPGGGEAQQDVLPHPPVAGQHLAHQVVQFAPPARLSSPISLQRLGQVSRHLGQVLSPPGGRHLPSASLLRFLWVRAQQQDRSDGFRLQQDSEGADQFPRRKGVGSLRPVTPAVQRSVDIETVVDSFQLLPLQVAVGPQETFYPLGPVQLAEEVALGRGAGEECADGGVDDRIGRQVLQPTRRAQEVGPQGVQQLVQQQAEQVFGPGHVLLYEGRVVEEVTVGRDVGAGMTWVFRHPLDQPGGEAVRSQSLAQRFAYNSQGDAHDTPPS